MNVDTSVPLSDLLVTLDVYLHGIVRGSAKTGVHGDVTLSFISKRLARVAVATLDGTVMQGKSLRLEIVGGGQVTTTGRYCPTGNSTAAVMSDSKYVSI